MAVQSGLGDNVYVDEFDLSGDVQSLGSIGGGLAGTFDVTGVDKSAPERVGLRRDGRLETTTFFNDAAGQAHPALSALPTVDVQSSYLRGTALGKPAASIVGKQVNYDGTEGTDGSLTFSENLQGTDFALEWGHNLTAGKATSAGAEALTGFDDGAGAATAFGLQAYLHVFAFTGTSAAITIQDSDDNGSGDAYALVTGASFASVTGVTSERIQTGRTENVKEWLRVNITGTYSNLVFAVIAVPNRYTAVAF